MTIEETGETRVRTNYLNFDVSLCIHAYKFKKIQSEEEDIGIIFLWDFRFRCSSRYNIV